MTDRTERRDPYREAAESIRNNSRRENDPGRIAALDQIRCALRDVWDYRGIDLENPIIAHAVFAAVGWAFSKFVETLQTIDDPTDASTQYGETLIATATALAEFVT
jgi:hypothetical protein